MAGVQPAACASYIRYLQRIESVNRKEYDKVPAVLKELSAEEIDHLQPCDIEALEAMKALPDTLLSEPDEDEILAARSYLRFSKRQSVREPSKKQAILQTLSPEEIDRLDAEEIKALRLLDLIPNRIVSRRERGKAELEEALQKLCDRNPELQSLADAAFKNPARAPEFAMHEDVQTLLAHNPDFRRVIEQEKQRLLQIIAWKVCWAALFGMSNPGFFLG